MNLRDLMNKLDAIDSILDEGFNYKTIQKQLGGITDVEQRHQAVAQLAVQNGLPGLYDPVDGKYVSNQNSVSNTADKDTDYLLAAKGLIPPNANTSTTLGRMFGTSGDKYDTGLRGQSDQFVTGQEREEFKQEKLGQLQDLMKQLMTLKKIPEIPVSAPAAPASSSGQSATPTATNATANTTGGPNMGQINKESKAFTLGLAQELTESFGYQLDELSEPVKAVAEPLAVSGAGGAASALLKKATGKAVPLAGAAFGAYDAYNRGKEGDWVGAGIAGLSGAVSLIPGVGWIPALALDAVNLGRDIAKGQGQGATPETPAAPANPNANPKLQQLQKIIGAKPDGLYGPETKEKLTAWQQKQGIKADGMPGPETYGKAGIKESLAESMRSLQARLALLENEQPQAVPEPNAELNTMAAELQQTGGQILKVGERIVVLMPDKSIIDPSTGDILDGSTTALTPTGQKFQGGQGVAEGRGTAIFQGIKDLIAAAKTGWHGAPVATGKLTKTGAAQMMGQDSKAFQKALAARPALQRGAYKASKFAGKNPIKTGLGVTAAGLAAGYGGQKAYDALTDPGQGPTPVGPNGPNKPNVHKPAPTPAEEKLVCSPEQVALIGKIKGVMGELGDVAKTDKAVSGIIQAYQEKIDAIGCSTDGQGATPAVQDPAKRSDLTAQQDQFLNPTR